LSTKWVSKRGADHTTHGIRMGIDGWIYIAVGDFGMVEAKGTARETVSLKGGGVVRIRPAPPGFHGHAVGNGRRSRPWIHNRTS